MGESGMPGIFFNYELAPVMVNRRYVVFLEETILCRVFIIIKSANDVTDYIGESDVKCEFYLSLLKETTFSVHWSACRITLTPEKVQNKQRTFYVFCTIVHDNFYY